MCASTIRQNILGMEVKNKISLAMIAAFSILTLVTTANVFACHNHDPSVTNNGVTFNSNSNMDQQNGLTA